MNKFCIIIPCYRHAIFIPGILAKLNSFNLPVIIVDDGNIPEDQKSLEGLARNKNNIYLISYQPNRGKGYAFTMGLKKAAELGYTHAIQLDADGQHNISDLNRIMEISEEHPCDLVSGAPLYDEPAPFARRFFRKLTTFFCRVETLSSEIKDAMIGFRSYPVRETLSLITSCHISNRMNFDIEIMVRLKWKGIHIKFFDTRIIYPENGISNFKVLRDNFYLSMLHTKLCTLMILTLPYRIYINATK